MQSNLGVALYFNGELTRAVSVLQKASALNPSLVAPHIFTGLSWYRLSNPDKAVLELQKATELSPSDVIAHTWLGYAYVAQSQFVPACKELQTAGELDPDNIDIWYALGQTYLEIGRNATIHLLTVAADGGRIWQLAAEQLLLKGDRDGALTNFQKALERRPDLTEIPGLIAEMGGSVVAVQKSLDRTLHKKTDSIRRRMTRSGRRRLPSSAWPRLPGLLSRSPDPGECRRCRGETGRSRLKNIRWF